MKTSVKTTIKGSENIFVKESVDAIYDALADKHAFIKLTLVSHDGKTTKIGIKKTSIKMFKE
jgi:hypothetical protein